MVSVRDRYSAQYRENKFSDILVSRATHNVKREGDPYAIHTMRDHGVPIMLPDELDKWNSAVMRGTLTMDIILQRLFARGFTTRTIRKSAIAGEIDYIRSSTGGYASIYLSMNKKILPICVGDKDFDIYALHENITIVWGDKMVTNLGLLPMDILSVDYPLWIKMKPWYKRIWEWFQR